MRLFILDTDRVGLDLALRAIAAGHEVKLYRPKGFKDGDGFPGLTTTTNYRDGIKWAGRDGLTTTTCNTIYMQDLDRWRAMGYPIWGPTKASANLEIDRAHGMEVMAQHDLTIAPYHKVNSLKEALAFAWKTDKTHCFKTLGSEEDKSLTFLAKDPGQMVEWIDNKIKSGITLKGPCMLQEKIDMIAEVGIAAYLSKDGFLDGKYEISFEFKKMMNDDFGPATGEAGTVIQYVKSGFMVDIIKRFENHYRALGHTGDIAINGGITKDGDYMPFEKTSRSGWPDEFIRRHLNKGDPVEWMKAAMEGRDELKVSYDCAVGVVCAQKPYPYSDGTPEEVEGKPIYGVDEVAENIHFAQVMMSKGAVWDGKKTIEDKLPRTTGPYVMVATGSGKSVSEARKDVYGTIDKISMADMLVRSDIGCKLEKQLPKLHALGIATEVIWD